MGLPFLIRNSRDSDIATITEIYAHAVLSCTATFELDPPDVAEMARRRQEILNSKYPYFVAEQDGKVLGYAYASYYRTRPAYRFSVENSVYVGTNHRGRGVGKHLMKKLIEQCEIDNYRLMIAVITGSDNNASIALHSSCGFKTTGVLPNVGWKFDQWLDTTFMVLPLGNGPDKPPA